jgi:uncharacterized protein (DUF58 family)
MRPTPAFAALLLAWAALGALCAFGLLPLSAWQLAGVAIVLAAAVDAARLWRVPDPLARRELPRIVPVGVEREATVYLQSGDAQAQHVVVHDLLPGDWKATGLPRAVELHPGNELALAYRFVPGERGAFEIPGCQLRLRSRWRLWQQRRTLPLRQSLRVYPNFAPVARFALFSAELASRVVGAHVRRNRGEGTEFQQLREYRVGDSLRQVDWKASQRARKLISRDYQQERNQQVLLMLDTGRRLLARDDALSHFDHVLDASLVVAYLALRQGDAVGLLASGGEHRWLAPQRGLGAIDTLLNTTYDLEARPVATDFLEAATEVSLRQRRRALVMLVTNVRDEDFEDLLAAVRLLQKKHLVCVASLREKVLDEALERPAETLTEAIGAGSLARYLDERERAHRALRSQGVMVLDVTCAQLPAALVERYLAVKREGLL